MCFVLATRASCSAPPALSRPGLEAGWPAEPGDRPRGALASSRASGGGVGREAGAMGLGPFPAGGRGSVGAGTGRGRSGARHCLGVPPAVPRGETGAHVSGSNCSDVWQTGRPSEQGLRERPGAQAGDSGRPGLTQSPSASRRPDVRVNGVNTHLARRTRCSLMLRSSPGKASGRVKNPTQPRTGRGQTAPRGAAWRVLPSGNVSPPLRGEVWEPGDGSSPAPPLLRLPETYGELSRKVSFRTKTARGARVCWLWLVRLPPSPPLTPGASSMRQQ